MSDTPPGWYPDPENPGGQRYWDGQEWTSHRASNTPGPVPPRGNSKTKAVVVGVLGLALFAGCSALLFGGGESTTSTESTPDPAQTDQVESPAEEPPESVDDEASDVNSRCVKVPRAVLRELGDGIRLTNGWGVRSDDYKEVWFVAAKYVNAVPVFSVNGDPRDAEDAFSGIVLAVNEDASDFTPWPYGPDTAARVSMDDDGAQEAYDCADLS